MYLGYEDYNKKAQLDRANNLTLPLPHTINYIHSPAFTHGSASSIRALNTISDPPKKIIHVLREPMTTEAKIQIF